MAPGDIIPSDVEKAGKHQLIDLTILYSHHRWLTYAEFASLCDTLYFITFSLRAERNTALELLNSPRVSPPISKDTRFPTGKVYVDLSSTYMVSLFSKLASALSIDTRDTEKFRINLPELEIQNYSRFQDGQVAYYNAIATLREVTSYFAASTAHTYGVFTRESYESIISPWVE